MSSEHVIDERDYDFATSTLYLTMRGIEDGTETMETVLDSLKWLEIYLKDAEPMFLYEERFLYIQYSMLKDFLDKYGSEKLAEVINKKYREHKERIEKREKDNEESSLFDELGFI